MHVDALRLPSLRHALFVTAAFLLASGCTNNQSRIWDPSGDPCMQCHGGVSVNGQPANWAPPRSTKGATDTADLGVGAHQRHLAAGSLIRAPITCQECHVVPQKAYPTDGTPPHFGKVRAAVTFGALATSGGASAGWSFGGQGSCSNVYCHGATVAGGSAKTPIWTRVDGSQDKCGSCHGFPPPAPHPAVDVSGGASRCSACHPATVTSAGLIDIAGGKHINGVLDLKGGGGTCTTCHGDSTRPETTALNQAAPPTDTQGRSGTTQVTVGAHLQHLHGGTVRGALACTDCHAVPAAVTDHDTSGTIPAVLSWSALATTGGAAPAWNRNTATCASTYCHGATLAGGSARTPQWTRVDGSQITCASCHGFPPPGPHPFADVTGGSAVSCHNCHSGTVTAAGAIDLAGGRHIDGALQIDALACNTCHGDRSATPAPTPASPLAAAPPVDARGNTRTTVVTVGAHQAHLTGGLIRSAIGCSECHTVPGSVAAHDTTGIPATLSFGALATSGGASPLWSRGPATCASTYCHGATLGAGGAATTPLWTLVDGSQITCASCHGFPPAGAHPAVDTTSGAAACNACHSGTVTSAGLIDLTGGLHIDGAVQIDALACNTCHGDRAATPAPTQLSPVAAAPPVDHLGNTLTSLVSVGAHQQHVRDGVLRAAIACTECHVVPATFADHDVSGAPATLSFGALANAGGVSPIWSRGPATCSSTYCHGASLGADRGTATTPQWTRVDGSQVGCGSCHGFPPLGAPHPVVDVSGGPAACSACHPGTVTPAGLIDVAGGLHIDGAVQVGTMACNACHGDKGAAVAPTPAAPFAAAPPVDHAGRTATSLVTVGAHQTHLVGGAIRGPLACTECHLVPATVGAHDTSGLVPATLTWGALATSSGVTPGWNRNTATCASTYCHGSTLAGGTATSPVWTNLDGSQVACGACHGFPPAAPHPALAAPITAAGCNACHSGTVTAAGLIDTTNGKHVNGAVDVDPLACNVCHGDKAASPAPTQLLPVAAAPPVDHLGNTLPSLVSVGAHQQHVRDGALRSAIACTECHTVPATYLAHDISGAPATLTFGALAAAGGVSPIWSRGPATCATTYCHGATLTGGTGKLPLWTKQDGTQVQCGSCHGFPPISALHPIVDMTSGAAACTTCHSGTVSPAGAILVAGGLHVDGRVEVDNMACNACHGDAAAVPAPTPASPLAAAPPRDHLQNVGTNFVGVGAHQTHLTGGAIRAGLACTECHTVPATVAAHDVSGLPASLTWGALATTGGVTPGWTRGTATCATTYCHGATLAGGTAKAPVWTTLDGTQVQCGSCHGFPPPSPHPVVDLSQVPAAKGCNPCHSASVTTGGLIDLAGGKHVDGTLQIDVLACNACHGDAAAIPAPTQASPLAAAPPRDHLNNVGTNFVGVGAHQTHLTGGAIRGPLACTECHTVPATYLAHDFSGSPATLTWGALATSSGVTPGWNRSTATCASTYCHGATLVGGTAKAPVWTTLDGTQVQCGACHGFPPAGIHPVVSAPITAAKCNACHSLTVTAAGAIDLVGGKHVDGTLQVDNMACNACHGDAAAVPAPTQASPLAAAPPRDHLQNSATTFVGVGAHQTHLVGGPIRGPLACTECHTVPATTAAHDVSGLPASLTWGPIASADGAAPAWTHGTATCASTYCHGATLAGGSATAPIWTKLDGTQVQCGSCHGFPPPAPHPFVNTATGNVSCRKCHSATITAGGAIDLVGGKHVDGTVQIDALACNTCHGSAANAAPPLDVRGLTATAAVTVGAHQKHLVDGAIRSAIGCNECHVVPALYTAHDVSGSTAVLTFGTLARSGGASPLWSRGPATCASTYCHGATLAAGGATTAPQWTKVDGTQVTCGSCHGFPPPAPHPYVNVASLGSAACNACHSGTVTAAGGINTAGRLHVNGNVEVDPMACNDCHGNPAASGTLAEFDVAPPFDASGQTGTALPTVGAHQAHLRDSAIRQALLCTDCHVKPATVAAHDTSRVPAVLTWSSLASHGATPSWDRSSATCSGVYCHGATLNMGGTLTKPLWTKVDGTQAACGTCHAVPPSSPHPSTDFGTRGTAACNDCHPGTVDALGNVIVPGLHINGQLDVSGAGACDGCHWPGVGTVGPNNSPPWAHTVHATPPALGNVSYGDQSVTQDVDPTGATGRYYFGCGYCHPTDLSHHMDGVVDVDLSPASGLAGGLKAHNLATAAYDSTTGTCSGVACHSTGQATLTVASFATAPAWSSGVTLACNGCHGDPPSYANGGPGSTAANTHIGLDVKGWEYGHVFGLPGSTHQSKHGRPSAFWNPVTGTGDQRAAVITCQACHYATVDPTNVKPGGYFYLDTSVTTSLAGGDGTRQSTSTWKDLQCTSCHAAGNPAAPLGTGKILPVKHVNGSRDVVFDPRSTMPANYLSNLLDTYTPTRPYFFTKFRDTVVPSLPTDAIIDGTPPGGTFSARLTGASYAATTQTCSGVACHLQQTSVRWGDKAFETPAAGTTGSFSTTACITCHPLP